jgi:GGDEF domain-containing protein
LPQIVSLADLFVALVARRRIGVLPDLLDAGNALCGMTRADLLEIVQSLETNVRQLGDVLSLELPTGLGYCDVLAEAHARLADEVSTGLSESDSLDVAAASVQTEPPRPPEISGAAPRLSPPPPPRVATASAAGNPPAEAVAGSSPETSLLLGRLAAMVTCCRTQRRELSLMLVAVDNYDELVRHAGRATAQRFAARLEAALLAGDFADAVMLPMTAAQSALLIPGCDRAAAVAFGRHLIAAADTDSTGQAVDGDPAAKLSIGSATVAVPSRNFSARALIDSAQRCLHAAQASRNNSMKSIEVY